MAADRSGDPQDATKRIGFLYPVRDPLSPAHWSGTPASLASGLRALGFDIVPIPYHLPPIVRHAVFVLSNAHGRGAVAARSPLKAGVRSRVLARGLQRAQPIDALLAMGTDLYDLPRVVPDALPVATYDDGTFALYRRHPESPARRHGFPESEIRQWAARQAAAARRATACCVSTRWAASSLIDDYGVPTRNVHVVGIGHRPRPSALPRDWSSPRLLFVGVGWEQKNGDTVLRAFARLRAHHRSATLDVVGDHPRLDQPGVIGHGFLPREERDAQQKLDVLYARATAFVLPSRFDAAGMAYLEAASAGLPVIATTEGGAPEMLGNAAITVHPDDEDSLTDAMERLTEPTTAQRLGLEASRRVADSTWPAVARRIVASVGVGAEKVVQPVESSEGRLLAEGVIGSSGVVSLEPAG
jgi:glycosyltransferase involved in cell wall biosynthesis